LLIEKEFITEQDYFSKLRQSFWAWGFFMDCLQPDFKRMIEKVIIEGKLTHKGVIDETHSNYNGG
jgi:hypothetical protein